MFLYLGRKNIFCIEFCDIIALTFVGCNIFTNLKCQVRSDNPLDDKWELCYFTRLIWQVAILFTIILKGIKNYYYVDSTLHKISFLEAIEKWEHVTLSRHGFMGIAMLTPKLGGLIPHPICYPFQK